MRESGHSHTLHAFLLRHVRRHERDAALLFQETPQQAERGLVPLECLETGVASLVIEQVVCYGTLKCRTCPPVGKRPRCPFVSHA